METPEQMAQAAQEVPDELETGPPKKKSRRKAPTPQQESNDPMYWNDLARDVVQRIAIVRFRDDKTIASGTETTVVASELKSALDDAFKQPETDMLIPVEPSLRPWKSTFAICMELSKHMHADFALAIKDDLDAEYKTLESFHAGSAERSARVGWRVATATAATAPMDED